MFNITVPDTINQMYATFYLVGIWKNKDGITLLQYFYIFYYTMLLVSVFLGACLTENDDEVIYLIVTTFVGIVQACRLYCLIWKQNEIVDFTKAIGISSTNDYEIFNGAANKLKKGMTFTKLFIFILLVAGVAVVFFPVGASEKRIIFNVAFPLDYKSSTVAFWIVYAFVTFGFFLSTICCVSVVIMWYLMFTLTIKYEILGSQLKNLGLVETVATKVKRIISTAAESNELYRRQFVEAIENHENINKITESFTSTFSSLFLLQVASSSICICGSIYTLAFSSHENWIQDAFFCVILFYSFVDSFLLMYLGNEIKLSSDRLSYCIYESDWIVQMGSCKHQFLLVLERLKQPQELIVGKIFPLNLQTFTVIVNRAYSMFNILQNIRK